MSKCKSCKRKVNNFVIEIFTCKCQNIYCRHHMHAHNCTYDYKNEFKEKMKDQLPVIRADKIQYRI